MFGGALVLRIESGYRKTHQARFGGPSNKTTFLRIETQEY